MASKNEIEILENIARCEAKLQELVGYTALDYEGLESDYGDPNRVMLGSDEKAGSKCSVCPAAVGGCAVREVFQELASEHRAKFETTPITAGGGNTRPERDGPDGGWNQMY